MKNLFFITLFFGTFSLRAQKVTAIEVNGTKYEVCDMTGSDRITWGGNEQIGASVRDKNDGAKNTAGILSAVGDNKGFNGKIYAARACANLRQNQQSDWYLPAQDEMLAIYKNNKLVLLPEKNTYWTSTEAAGTQAHAVYIYNGAVEMSAKVNSNHYVCIRKAN